MGASASRRIGDLAQPLRTIHPQSKKTFRLGTRAAFCIASGRSINDGIAAAAWPSVIFVKGAQSEEA